MTLSGIRLQIDDDISGYLVNTVEECTVKVLYLLRNSLIARKMGEQGKEKVRKQFLVTEDVLRKFITAQAYIFIGVQGAFSGLPGSIKDYQWSAFPARPHLF